VSDRTERDAAVQRVWTAEDVMALGVRTTVPVAGEIIAGLCKDESYRMVARGEFPVPVIKVGKNRLVVPTAPILRLLDIGPQDANMAGPAPPGPAAGGSRSPALKPDGSSAEDVDAA
jgi:hypothetical protein